MKKNFLWIFVIVASLCVAPICGLADDARELHKKGVALFKAEKYEEAASAFREAHRLRPTWKLLYNIGQCEAASKRYGLALEAFEAYLVEGGDEVPQDRADRVSSELRRIQPLVGTLKVEAQNGVEILIDGIVRATTPLTGPVRVASGSHTVVLRKKGESIYTQNINVAGGMATMVAMSPEPEQTTEEQVAEPPAEDTDPIPTQTIQRPGLRKTGVVLLVGGGVVLMGGAITGIMAFKKNGDLESNCPEPDNCPTEYQDLSDSSKNLANVTNVLLGVGGAAAATGVVLLLVSKKGSTDEEDSSSVRATPIAGPGVAGLSITGRF